MSHKNHPYSSKTFHILYFEFRISYLIQIRVLAVAPSSPICHFVFQNRVADRAPRETRFSCT